MKKSFLLMIVSAILYAFFTPLTKLLLGELPSTFLGGLTYLGSALGMTIVFIIARLTKKDKDELLNKKDFMYVAFVNVLDVCSSLCLFYGISLISSEEASLLQSFEVVSTALVAFLVFKEKISWRLLVAIIFLLCGSIFLAFDFNTQITFNLGAFFVLLAVTLFGISNNVIKKVANKDSLEFSIFKSLVPGLVLIIIALCTKEYNFNWPYISYSLVVGFLTFGVSVFFYAIAVRKLSASLGTTVFSSNPFFAAIISLLIFKDILKWNFYVSLILLIIGEIFAAYDNYINDKKEQTVKQNVENGLEDKKNKNKA